MVLKSFCAPSQRSNANINVVSDLTMVWNKSSNTSRIVRDSPQDVDQDHFIWRGVVYSNRTNKIPIVEKIYDLTYDEVNYSKSLTPSHRDDFAMFTVGAKINFSDFRKGTMSWGCVFDRLRNIDIEQNAIRNA
jgi:hypothetical protein